MLTGSGNVALHVQIQVYSSFFFFFFLLLLNLATYVSSCTLYSIFRYKSARRGVKACVLEALA